MLYIKVALVGWLELEQVYMPRRSWAGAFLAGQLDQEQARFVSGHIMLGLAVGWLELEQVQGRGILDMLH